MTKTVAIALLFWAATIAAAQKEATQNRDTLWIIPHIHWEGAVFKTREEYLEIGVPHILTVLRLLKTHPDYRFVLDQMAFVKPFLERYPEEEATFRKFVAERRLELVGGTDIMLDVNMPSGESWVRQALYGKGYFRDKLGVDVTVGWALDTFGHHAQMPQLLKLAGFKSYWFFRGVLTPETAPEFLWQGIDGTQIPAFVLGQGGHGFYNIPKSASQFERFALERFAALELEARGGDRVAWAMTTAVAEPEEHLPIMVEEFNRKRNMPFSIRFGVPTDYEAGARSHGSRAVVAGELNPLFQGVYSSRIDIKQWNRGMERLLTTAEKLDTLAEWLGVPVKLEDLARAWEPVLFNQTHDLASGVMTDKVYADSVRSYEFSQRLGEEMVGTSLDGLTSKIDTTGDGVPVVVFNGLGWSRTDIAEVDVGFVEPGIIELGLVDASGKALPIQVLEAERSEDGSLKHAKVAFVAQDVPPLGYAVYQVIPRREVQPVAKGSAKTMTGVGTSRGDTGSIENESYRATFNLWTGEMTSLLAKSSNWEVLNGPANVVGREQDGGDFWELYGTLGGGVLPQTRKILLPRPARTQWSNEWVGGSGSTSVGPVFSEYRVSHPFGSGDFVTRIRLYTRIPRVDIHTEILNNDKLVRYRVLFPTSIRDGKRVDEIPFGAIERPSSQEFPAQNWFDYGNGTQGVAVLNRALPGSNVVDGTLLVSLMRSARITAYPSVEGYEQGISSDSGLELGKRLTFDYALVPHSGDWRQSEVYRAGMEFNNPLIARKAARHVGSLPKRWGLLEVSHPNVVVSTLKPGREGGAVLRVYEASGQSTPGVKIRLAAELESAFEANLLEQSAGKLQVQDNSLQFDLGPFQIKTFQLRLGASRTRR
jgi:alpha-mannosidase